MPAPPDLLIPNSAALLVFETSQWESHRDLERERRFLPALLRIIIERGSFLGQAIAA